jgi:predicted metal-binding membrane protein
MYIADRPWRSTGPALAVGLTIAAWIALSVWAASPYDRYLHHEYQPDTIGGQGVALVLFLGGWLLMCTAMMLPTAVRLLRGFGAVARRHSAPQVLNALIVAGFLTSWLAVGYVLRAGDVGVHALVDSIDPLAQRPQLIGGLVLVAAGVFQFTALKYRCLTACRSPSAFVYRYWSQGRAAEAWRIGLAYGTSCIGCCWALMLVMFALGSVNLIWMLGLAAVMTVEKSAPMGPRASRPVGLALIGLGLVRMLF